MKSKNQIPKIALLIAICGLFPDCKPKPMSILLEPTTGSPGDLVSVKILNAIAEKNSSVSIGSETALIVKSTDSNIVVMVPPLQAQNAQVTLTSGKKSASAAFQVAEPATIRLWFKMSDKKVSFIESQSSNEEFQQDKSFSQNKMMYEIMDSKGESITIGYISDPSNFEVPSEDKNGFSQVDIKGEVNFSLNIPAFKDLFEIRFSIINASTKYRPVPLEVVSLRGAVK
jgi:hypothetical protein